MYERSDLNSGDFGDFETTDTSNAYDIDFDESLKAADTAGIGRIIHVTNIDGIVRNTLPEDYRLLVVTQSQQTLNEQDLVTWQEVGPGRKSRTPTLLLSSFPTVTATAPKHPVV